MPMNTTFILGITTFKAHIRLNRIDQTKPRLRCGYFIFLNAREYLFS